MTHTSKSTVIADYIFDSINTAKASLSVDEVLYGQHETIPGGVVVTVTPGTKTRALGGVAKPGGVTNNVMIVIITVYNSRTEDEAAGRLRVDQTAEAIEDLLHADTTLGNRVMHGMVETWDPGVRFRPGSLFRVNQMIYVGKTHLRLAP